MWGRGAEPAAEQPGNVSAWFPSGSPTNAPETGLCPQSVGLVDLLLGFLCLMDSPPKNMQVLSISQQLEINQSSFYEAH